MAPPSKHRRLVCLAAALAASARAPAAVVTAQTLAQGSPSLAALGVGGLLYVCWPDGGVIPILMVFFGAQTGMSLYVKTVLSKIPIDTDAGMKGVPIGFLMTAIQQLVAFVAFCLFLFIGRALGMNYEVKRLANTREWMAVLCFSVAFALNIGLNNFSQTMLSLSVNLIIRSCLPLATALVELALGSFAQRPALSCLQWILMLIGVAGTICVSYVKSETHGSDMAETTPLGILSEVGSICAAALNMVLAGILGANLRLNPLDSTFYMAVPAGLTMIAFSFIRHPGPSWPDFSAETDWVTDWTIVREVMSRNPWAMRYVAFSGFLAFGYNWLQYTLVQKLSATHASFASSFNTAATIGLSLWLGLEPFPDGWHGKVFVFAIAANIISFTLFNLIRHAGKN